MKIPDGSQDGVTPLNALSSLLGYQNEWCGSVLDEPAGKNDGSVKGKKYFECKPKHGLIVRSHECMRADKTRPLKLPKAAFE